MNRYDYFINSFVDFEAISMNVNDMKDIVT